MSYICSYFKQTAGPSAHGPDFGHMLIFWNTRTKGRIIHCYVALQNIITYILYFNFRQQKDFYSCLYWSHAHVKDFLELICYSDILEMKEKVSKKLNIYNVFLLLMSFSASNSIRNL